MQGGFGHILSTITYQEKCEIRTINKPPHVAAVVAELVLMFDPKSSAEPYSWKIFCNYITNNMQTLLEIKKESLSALQLTNIQTFIQINNMEVAEFRQKVQNFGIAMLKFYDWALSILHQA